MQYITQGHEENKTGVTNVLAQFSDHSCDMQLGKTQGGHSLISVHYAIPATEPVFRPEIKIS